uniref:helix-turn-helix domain-containing protein n=1 Tax=Salipiger marinus TaxID=555512 RepID=UPI0035CAB5E4
MYGQEPGGEQQCSKGHSLCFAEREEIALECAWGTGVRAIRRKLGRSSRTIAAGSAAECARPGQRR